MVEVTKLRHEESMYMALLARLSGESLHSCAVFGSIKFLNYENNFKDKKVEVVSPSILYKTAWQDCIYK